MTKAHEALLRVPKKKKKKKDRICLMFTKLMDSRTFDYVLGIRHFDFQI